MSKVRQSLAAAALLVAAACSDSGPEVVDPIPVSNRGPEAAGVIAAQTVPVGETATTDVSPYFRDADGDVLSYTASSSDTRVGGASASGSSVAVSALAKGVFTVTVTARDPYGLTAQQSFEVTAPNREPEAVGTMPAQTVFAEETVSVDASAYFRDLDGDPLSYETASSDERFASATVAGAVVTIRGVEQGAATITVTASDMDGGEARQSFPVTVPNRGPEPVSAIPAQTVLARETVSVDVSTNFRDPDGDALTFSAATSAPGVAAVSVSGGVLNIAGVAAGTASVTVTARDPHGLTAESSFDVTVETPASGFNIELVFATSVTHAQRAMFERAAERWMAILAPMELPDMVLNRTLTCYGDPILDRYVEMIDDLMIVVAAVDIDGTGGTLGQAAPCELHASSWLPFYGSMEFDKADLDDRERSGDLEDVILHEMGHVLGIGTIWSEHGLLRNPSSGTEARDTHFTGPLAVDAFDDAGGTAYRGPKVPVENRGGPGTRNGHWRQNVFGMELMIGYADGGPERSPLSAITIQSLADLGYAVDVTAADPYRLPGADAARLIDEARRIPYGNDIRKGPIVLVDEKGRVVRVIPG